LRVRTSKRKENGRKKKRRKEGKINKREES
jgi:hypothetical protein